MFGERRISIPTGYYQADIGDSGTRILDGRNFVELAWHRPLGHAKNLKWRAYYDQFRYDGIYNYLQSYNSQNFDGAAGNWIGTQLLYQQENTKFGSFTVGAEANIDIRNIQYNYSVVQTPAGPERQENFLIRQPNATFVFFVQDEWKPAPDWTVYLGGRFDDSRQNSGVFSPRAAVVYKRNSTTYKLVYGRAFRNPSTLERYYTPNPALAAERIQSIEASREQQLNKRLKLLTSVFHYGLSGLIQGVLVANDALEYENSSKASATGLEMELDGHPFKWLDTTVSYTLTRARGANDQHRLQNSPAQIAQFHAAVPFDGDRMVVAAAVRYVSSRIDAFAGVVAATAVVDVTATAKFTKRLMDLQFGIRNLLDQQYADPLSPGQSAAVIPQAGRSVYVKLTWHGD